MCSFVATVAKTKSHAFFRSIAWADVGQGSPMGIIAGGHVDGCVTLWDPSKIMNAEDGAAIFRRDLHAGKDVNCLEFNPNKTTLLGTGGSDGHVQVLSIERPSQPDVFRGVTTTRHANTEITCLAWNRKVQHVLATSSNQGLTVIWDLKNKKEVISFKDPANRTRCSALSWHPDIATQFLVAFNDDTNPCIQMWDMRNCSYPFKEYQEHTRGVTCASFCELDSNLLISSGRDNRTVCWSTHSGQLDAYSELNLTSPAVKLDWSPCLPGFVAASGATGVVSIHSISQRQTPAASTYPPKWGKIPCGVSFGFGGKVVTFGSNQGPRVSIHVVPDEPAVVDEADRFESYLATDLRPFCNAKVEESRDEHEKMTWTLISLLFEGPEARRRIASVMGVDQAEICAMAEKYLGKVPSSAQAIPPSGPGFEAKPDNFGLLGDTSNMNPDQLDDLFDQLARNSEQQQQNTINSANNSVRGTPRAFPVNPDDHILLSDWSQGPEAVIKQSLLIGDLESAVECCLKSGRLADALFFAASGSPELWKRTREEYARKQKDPFIRLVGHVLANDMEKFVIRSDLSSWAETLVMLITYVRDQSFVPLVEMLGERLEKERFDVRSAVLCYLTCGSFANAVRIWASMSNTQGSPSQSLQILVEKMSCLFSAIRPAKTESVFSHKMLQYATLLANSGRIVAAMRCLILVPDSAESRILKDRIYNAAPSQMGQLVRGVPPFPFEVTDIRPLVVPGSTYPQAMHQTSRPGPSTAAPYGASTMPHSAPQATPPPQQGSYGAPVIQGPHGAPRYGGVPPVQSVAPAGLPQRSAPPASFGPPASGMQQSPPISYGNVVPPNPSRDEFPGQPTPPHAVARTIPSPAIPPRNMQPTGPSSFAPSPSAQRGPGSGSSTPMGSTPSYGGPAIPNPYQSGFQRPIAGPPTSGGVSTAPHATANPITPGMPVSWPVPNPIQQGLSPNVAVPVAKAPVGPVGEPVPAHEIGEIQRAFSGLLERNAQDGNKKKWEDTARKLGELYEKLATGQISRESSQKVKELAQCIDRGDFANASRLRVELSASDWERNRSWLFAVQLLLPK